MLVHSDPPQHVPNTVYLAGEELDLLLAYWLAQLGLQDWKVSLHVKRTPDMEPEGSAGSVGFTYSTRRARVYLLDPRDHRMTDDVFGAYDMEHVLVHELMHLRLAPLSQAAGAERGTLLHDTCVEHPVDQLAITLVAFRRAGETKKNRLGVHA